jgi:hypothetical protein
MRPRRSICGKQGSPRRHEERRERTKWRFARVARRFDYPTGWKPTISRSKPADRSQRIEASGLAAGKNVVKLHNGNGENMKL